MVLALPLAVVCRLSLHNPDCVVDLFRRIRMFEGVSGERKGIPKIWGNSIFY